MVDDEKRKQAHEALDEYINVLAKLKPRYANWKEAQQASNEVNRAKNLFEAKFDILFE